MTKKMRLWAVRDADEIRIYRSATPPELRFMDIRVCEATTQIELTPLMSLCRDAEHFLGKLDDQECIELVVRQKGR